MDSRARSDGDRMPVLVTLLSDIQLLPMVQQSRRVQAAAPAQQRDAQPARLSVLCSNVLVCPCIPGSVTLWELQPAARSVWVRVCACGDGLPRDALWQTASTLYACTYPLLPQISCCLTASLSA